MTATWVAPWKERERAAERDLRYESAPLDHTPKRYAVYRDATLLGHVEWREGGRSYRERYRAGRGSGRGWTLDCAIRPLSHLDIYEHRLRYPTRREAALVLVEFYDRRASAQAN